MDPAARRRLATSCLVVLVGVGCAALFVQGGRASQPQAVRARGLPEIVGEAGLASRDRPPSTARQAARAYEPPSGNLKALLARLDHPDRAARGDALVRLRTLGPSAVAGAERIFEVFRLGDPDLDLLATYTLAALGPDALPILEAALQDRDDRVRAGALSVLERMPTLWPHATDALRRGLLDGDEGVRAAALAAWSAHPAEATDEAERLVKRLEDPSARVRTAAALALGRLKFLPETAVPLLARLVTQSGEAEGARLEAVWALARYGPTAGAGAAALATAGAEGSGDVAREALRALVLLGPAAEEAVPALLRASERTDEPARTQTLTALAAVGATLPEVVRRLGECVRPGDPASSAAVAGLALGGEAGRRELLRASATADGREALARTSIALDPGPAGAGTRAALEALLSEPDEDLVRLALRSFSAAGARGSGSAEAVANALGQAPPTLRIAYVEALAEIGADVPAAAAAVLAAAARGDDPLRAAVARALGQMGVSTPEVAAFLASAAGSADDEVAAAARRARARLRLDR